MEGHDGYKHGIGQHLRGGKRQKERERVYSIETLQCHFIKHKISHVKTTICMLAIGIYLVYNEHPNKDDVIVEREFSINANPRSPPDKCRK